MPRFADLPVGSHFCWVALPSFVMIKTTSNSSRHNFEKKSESTPVTSFTHFMPSDLVELVEPIAKKPENLWGTVAMLLAGVAIMFTILIVYISKSTKNEEKLVVLAEVAEATAMKEASRAPGLKRISDRAKADEEAENLRLADEANRLRIARKEEEADTAKRKDEAIKWEIYQANQAQDRKDVADAWAKWAAESSANMRAAHAAATEADITERTLEDRIAAMEDADDAQYLDKLAKQRDDEWERRKQERADDQEAIAAQMARMRQQELEDKINEIARRQRLNRIYRMKN